MAFKQNENETESNLKPVNTGMNSQSNESESTPVSSWQANLQGVFLPLSTLDIHYESLLAPWQEAFYKILFLPEEELEKAIKYIEDLSAQEPDFLEVSLEALLEIPIDPRMEEAIKNIHTVSEGGIDSQMQHINYNFELSGLDKDLYKVLSLAQTLDISPLAIFVPKILLPPINNPNFPSPTAPPLFSDSVTFPNLPPADQLALNQAVNEFYLNSYQKIEIHAHLSSIFGSTFGYNVGATPGPPPATTLISVDASFSPSNVNPNPGGEQNFPTKIILTTLQGNTLVLYTQDDIGDGRLKGDLIYTINNPFNTPPLPEVKIDLNAIGDQLGVGYDDIWLYSVVNEFNNGALGELHFRTLDDVPVTSSQTGPTLNESEILTIGSEQATSQHIAGGELLTILTPSGTLVIDNTQNPVSTIPANATYFGADKVGALVHEVKLLGVDNATVDGSTAIAEVSNIVTTMSASDITALNNLGIFGSKAGDSAIKITDNLGNIFLVDRVTGHYLYFENKAFFHDSPDSPLSDIGGQGVDAAMKYSFQLKDGDGDLSNISTLTLHSNDDIPIAFVRNNAVNETNYYVEYNKNNTYLEKATGNLITDGTDVIFGADGQGMILGIVFKGVLTKDGDAGDLDAASGSILLNTQYGSFLVDTQGAGIGTYTWTMDISKVQPLDGDALDIVYDIFGYYIQDADGSLSTTGVNDADIGYSSKITIEIDLNKTPDAVDDPAMGNDYSVFENGILNVTAAKGLLANDTDPDDPVDTRVISSIDTTATVGKVSFNSDGSFSFDTDNQYDYLAAGESTTTTFKSTTSDAEPLSDESTATITIKGVNDAPDGKDTTITILEDGSRILTAADFKFTDPIDGTDDDFIEVKITSIPLVGDLKLGGVAVVAGQFITVADLNANKLVYTPVANQNGDDYATLTFQVRDDGGTANGGVDLDQTANTLTFDITSVNDAPAGANNKITLLEDGSYTFTTADFGFTDPVDFANPSAGADAFQSVFITTLAADGKIKLNGVDVSAGDEISVTDIAAGKLTFVPDANENGLNYGDFTFQVKDDGGTANSGVDTDQSANTFQIDVTLVNDAPSGANKQITINEDTPYTFLTTDFGFTDIIDAGNPAANAFQSVFITTLAADGKIKLNGVNVTVNQEISVADIMAGNLTFVPDANENGLNYGDFTFQVKDDGGTANSGVDTDQSANTFQIDVTLVNDEPEGANKQVTINEDASYTFLTTDFGFSDPVDAGNPAANAFQSVFITTLAADGKIKLSGVNVSAGDEISVTDIAAGKLTFVPDANENGLNYGDFTFQVKDDGGTANSGVDTDQSANTFQIDVTLVNDEPEGANKQVTINEDASYTFLTTDFGFSDPADAGNPAANAFQSVFITTLAADGKIKLSGVNVSAGDEISVTDITAGKLTFVPDANENGLNYGDFTFQVKDDGGTANSGVDTDQSANTFQIDVTLVNDEPAGANKTVTTLEDTGYVFAATDFVLTDPNDSPANALKAVKIVSLPGVGSLTLNNIAVTLNQFIDVADINGGLLKFAPLANENGTNYANFDFQVQDDGGTANGGVDLDQTSNKMRIDVTLVNDAPQGDDKTVTFAEDSSYTFSTSDFGFSDPNDPSPSNNLDAVIITTIPLAGSLTLNALAVTAGQSIAVGDITSNKLVFTPVANANGTNYANFTFQVKDNGGTLNGGVDTDQSANTITINVTASNDAPLLSGTNTPSFDISNGTPVTVNSVIAVTDIDSTNLLSATIEITNDKTGDILQFTGTLPSGITLTGNNSESITLSGSDTLANYQSVLQNIQFDTTNKSNSDRNVEWTATDSSSAVSNTLTTTINVVAPVVLDLNGDGIHLLSAKESGMTLGDISGTQNQQSVGWIGEGDGVLMYDINGNGILSNLNQISFVSYTPGAKTDLQGLIAFDSNFNGILDQGDDKYDDFGVLKSDGKFESLTDMGIVNISLTSDNNAYLQNGNLIFGSSSMQMADGKAYQVADVGFGVGPKSVPISSSDVLPASNGIDFSALPTTVASPPMLSAQAAPDSASNASHGLNLVQVAHLEAQFVTPHLE